MKPSTTPSHPWLTAPEGEKWILGDPSTGGGLGAFEAALGLKVNIGGYTLLAPQAPNRLRFPNLIQMDRFSSVVNNNIRDADGVVILSHDPRSTMVSTFLTTAKERHRDTRIIFSPESLEEAKAWIRTHRKLNTLCVLGLSTTTADACKMITELLGETSWAAPTLSR